MKKRISNLIVVVLLIVSMVCGCSNNANQTSVSTDNDGSKEKNSRDVVSQIEKSMTVLDYYENTNAEDIDTVKFGKYPQSDVNGNKMDDIEWYVIKKDGNEAMLLSKYLLDRHIYTKEEKEQDFEYTNFCKWLNDDFYNTAFKNNDLIIANNGIKVSLLDYDYISSINESGRSLKNYRQVLIADNTKYSKRYFIEKSVDELKNETSSQETNRYLVNEKVFNDNDYTILTSENAYIHPNWQDYDSYHLYDQTDIEAYYIYRKPVSYTANGQTNVQTNLFHISKKGIYTYSPHTEFSCVRPVIFIKMNGDNEFLSEKVVEDKREKTKRIVSRHEISNESYFDLNAFSESVNNSKSITDYSIDFNSELDSIKFGKFYIDDASEKIRDLEWIILEKDTINKKVLLLSKDIIKTLPMYNYWDGNTKLDMQTYEYSTVRNWLNSAFYNLTFTNKEKKIICDTVVSVEKSDKSNVSNLLEASKIGNVIDKIFLLNTDEILRYFQYDIKKEYETDYGSTRIIENYVDNRVRSNLTDYAKYYEYNGEIYGNKYPQMLLRNEGTVYMDNEYQMLSHISNTAIAGIRPAMWVSYDEDNTYEESLNGWNNGFYYEEGIILTNQYTPDGVFVNYNGVPVDIENDKLEINKNDVNINAWYRTKNGIWYYFETNKETMKKGWHYDPRDNQVYYLDDDTGVMVTGWKEIDRYMYYFNEEHAVTPNWYYVESLDEWQSYGYDMKSYGSMFRDEETPDGKRVDADGKLIK